MWALPVISLTALLLWVVAAASACSAPSTGPTFGQLADSGKTVFANRCAKCHGDRGQGVIGPAIIGSSAQLSRYNTAKGLLDFISVSMPQDAPGTLSQQDYQQVLCYLLVQNGLAKDSSTFNVGGLQGIQLK